MWLFTKTGYISAVENQDDKTTLILRARVWEDLKNFRQRYMGPTNAKITRHINNDYPYRLVVRKTEFASAMVNVIADIDYKNFKSKVSEVQGYQRSSLYTRIWAVLIDLEKNHKRIKNYFNKQLSFFDKERTSNVEDSTASTALGDWHGESYYNGFNKTRYKGWKDVR